MSTSNWPQNDSSPIQQEKKESSLISRSDKSKEIEHNNPTSNIVDQEKNESNHDLQVSENTKKSDDKEFQSKTINVPLETEGEQQQLIVQIPEEIINKNLSEKSPQVISAQIISDITGSSVIGEEVVHLMITDENNESTKINQNSQDKIKAEFNLPSTSDSNKKSSTQESLEAEWMTHVDTITVDENPPLLDESSHRIIRKLVDGTHEEIYECEYCQKHLYTPAQLTAHRWHHTKPFQCEKCHDRFATKGNLVVHRRKHTGEKPFGCKQCEGRFSTRGNLRRHERTHTGAKPWVCMLCPSRFTEKKSLRIHMRKHTGERPYECNTCGKKFAQSSILNTHKKLHENKKGHLCHLCGKAFRQKSQLKLHTLRHDGIRKFGCDQCQSKFITKADLDRHERVHTGERPYGCNICVKTFTRQQSLREHKNRHYGKTPYECKICGKAYAEMSACYKHLKTHKRNTTKDGSKGEDMIIRDFDLENCKVIYPEAEAFNPNEDKVETEILFEISKDQIENLEELNLTNEGPYVLLGTSSEIITTSDAVKTLPESSLKQIENKK